ncbi:MAG: YfhO family protein [Thermoanaerobaculaceae bacterium]|nr:YfhO family protein [Thermoanaerobaculaceae bacterium]
MAASGTYLWLRRHGRGEAGAVLGALVFSFSGAFVAWLEHPHTLVAAPTPWLILFTEELVCKPSRRAFVGLAASTFLVLSGGHPETTLMVAILASAVLVWRAKSLGAVVRPAVAALLGAGLAAPLWLPFAEYFAISGARDHVNRFAFLLEPTDMLRFLWPRAATSHPIETAATVSVTVLVLCLWAVIRGRRDRELQFWAGLLLAMLIVVYFKPVSRGLAELTPVYWTRLLLLVPLPFAWIAATALDRLQEMTRARQKLFAEALGAVAVSLVAVELLAAAQGVHGTTDPSLVGVTTPLVMRLQEDPEVFRVLPLGNFLPPNLATSLGIDEIRGFDSVIPRDWRRVRESIGEFRHDMMTPDRLKPGGHGLNYWNIKYLLAHPSPTLSAAKVAQEKDLDLAEIYRGVDGVIWENRRVQPRARLQGSGRITLVSRVATRWQWDVGLDHADSLTIANPAFPGWTAYIDGRPTAVTAATGEALVISIPKGHHTVEIRYWPNTLRAGLIASALAMVLLLTATMGPGRRWLLDGDPSVQPPIA